MFKLYTEAAIDMVQSGKKMFVDTFVKHEGLAKSLNDFVDTQTEYTKKAVDTLVTTGKEVYKTVTDKSFVQDNIKSFSDTLKEYSSKKASK